MDRKFIRSEETPWEVVGEGVKRQILGYDEKIMIVRVDFQENAVGYVHQHFHSQSTFILSGKFKVTIGDREETLKEGDSFFVPSGMDHGVHCIEEGALLDAFSPARQDFLSAGK